MGNDIAKIHQLAVFRFQRFAVLDRLMIDFLNVLLRLFTFCDIGPNRHVLVGFAVRF